MDMLTGKDIREVREKLGLSQAAFAGRLGVSENTVRRWELDYVHPRWAKMVAINEMRNGKEQPA